MNVNIQDLPESVIERYEATARARGVSLDAFLRDYLIQNARLSNAPLSNAPLSNARIAPPAQMSAEEWEKALDECFDAFPATGPLPDEAFRRESIYGREDKW